MKLVLFSLEEGAMGGVAAVNAVLRDEMRARGHEVTELFLRAASSHGSASGAAVRRTPWRFTEGREIKDALRRFRLFSAAGLAFRRLGDVARYRADLRRCAKIIARLSPDAILASHYLLLDAIPKEALSRSFFHVHTSFAATVAVKSAEKTMRRYNGKIGFLWLSEGICAKAVAAGFQNSRYLYNPLKRFPTERVRAEENGDLVILARFSAEKRLPLAVRLLRAVMEQHPEKPFRCLFYGDGPERETLLKAIGGDARFVLAGTTSDAFQALQTARLTVNTSAFEGFSIALLEAVAAGVPAVSFDFGEAAREEILSGKTGFVVPMGDEAAFCESVGRILTNDDLCRALSEGARRHAARFDKEKIASDLEALLAVGPLDKTRKSE